MKIPINSLKKPHKNTPDRRNTAKEQYAPNVRSQK